MTEEKNTNQIPLLGEKFPSIEVQTTKGKMKIPDHYKGKWFVLFSHPADFTPVCTTEFYSFSKNYSKFKELDTELIGMSIDQVFSHIKWAEWIKDNLNEKIEFPIIADHGKLAKRLGMVHENKGSNTVRAVFIVDPNGNIRTILYYPQEVGRNISEIVRTVKALQISDKHKVAMPANWPKNELIKDKVIIPPIDNIEKIEERKKKYDNYDWWFAYKDLE